MKKLYCYSQQEFNDLCCKNGWDDYNTPEDTAFISITGRGEENLHWFKKDCENILNLEFDDISEPTEEWKGRVLYGISEEQSIKCLEFIENNLGKNMIVHCKAGKSRSQGIIRFILDMYPSEEYKTREDNQCISPNMYVVRELKRVYYIKNGLFNETIN